MKNEDPIIYACAGCSVAGQTAYKLALRMDEEGKGKMSCLAGVASQRPSFLKEVKGRKVLVIDGCPIECAKNVFTNLNIPIDRHIKLHSMGVKKNVPPSDELIDALKNQIIIDY